ncbi:helix-turn-helix domain-containing protein [Clostridium folliculivorans]|nr:helix-turn-helix domain-containing protein [Clostridium folliculivorans]
MTTRKILLQDIVDNIGIINANLSILKSNKAKAIRFSILEVICKELNCKPGDILEYTEY